MNIINWKPERSEHLSYILGVLYGDGYISKYGYVIGLHSGDRDFAEAFCRSLNEIGLHGSLGKDKIYYRVFAQSKRFIEWFEDLSLEKVKDFISDYKADFLKGFYDSEGNLGIEERKGREFPSVRIRIVNTNRSLLELVKDILSDFWIASNISVHYDGGYRDNWQKCWYLDLHSYTKVRIFLEEVGSSIYRKSLKFLERELKNYPRSSRRVYTKSDYRKAVRLYKEEKMGADRISKEMGIPRPTVGGWIYRGNVPRYLKPFIER